MEHLLSRHARATTSSVIRDLLAVTERPDVLSLAGGLPPEGLLPVAELVEGAAALDGPALQYGPTEGHRPLREWIAAVELGRMSVDGVVVTHGSQQALDLVVRCLVDPGDVVVVEEPTYVGALGVLRAAGARVVAVPGDADGIDTEALADLLASGPTPRLCYLAPTFQNPSGSVLSPARRAHLGALAERHRLVVVDDDPYRELGFERPPPRLSRWVPAELSVSLGSFSKTLAPGLRVGWLHAPPWLAGAVVRAKQAADLHTSGLAQRLVHRVVGDDQRQRARLVALRAVLAERAAALTDALEALPGARVAPVRGGMFAWLDLPGVDTDRLLPAALAEGVAFVPGSAFAVAGQPTSTARLCFATLEVPRLHDAVERLGDALATCGTGATHGSRDPVGAR